ncbi:MAG: phosphate butyryltransferase [Bacteroidales bacterium]|jgi:phosphate butyryltransferase|nr:phosphate butyryltransferase [Bacteroidales bacterium]MCR5827308.1 phosphate butyryltransferase [Bacteroidales bacterium]
MITNFDQMFEALRSKPKKRLVAAWAVDDHTITAAYKACSLGIVDATLVGDADLIKDVCTREGIDASVFEIVDNKDELASIAQAIDIIREGNGDILMKGLCSTDKYMRGILNKERGLLPPKAVLSHVSVLQNPNYHKFIILGDMAVIPAPDLKQKEAITKYLVNVAKAFGIQTPKVAFIAATEQMMEGMQACVDAAILSKKCDRGQIKGCVGDGPLALDVALSPEAVAIKKLKSEVAGDADCLVFPNIESANVFYKSNSQLMKGVKQAAIVAGAAAPCVLSSRADSIDTKLNSIALAALTAKSK